MDNTDRVLFRNEDTVGVVTFNQPNLANSFTWELLGDLEEIQNSIAENSEIRAVVLQGNGKHFSAGMDLTTLQGTDFQFMLRKIDWMQNIMSRWQELNIPVIAAIKGACIGAALEMALACDFRISTYTARFQLPEVGLGLSPDLGGTTRLAKLIGSGQAKRMLLGNEAIDGNEAHRIGLVEIIVNEEDLGLRTMKLAQRMAQMPPIGMRWAKKGVNLAADSSVTAGLLFEQAQSIGCFMTEDIREGINSLIEKRQPQFKGR